MCDECNRFARGVEFHRDTIVKYKQLWHILCYTKDAWAHEHKKEPLPDKGPFREIIDGQPTDVYHQLKGTVGCWKKSTASYVRVHQRVPLDTGAWTFISGQMRWLFERFSDYMSQQIDINNCVVAHGGWDSIVPLDGDSALTKDELVRILQAMRKTSEEHGTGSASGWAGGASGDVLAANVSGSRSNAGGPLASPPRDKEESDAGTVATHAGGTGRKSKRSRAFSAPPQYAQQFHTDRQKTWLSNARESKLRVLSRSDSNPDDDDELLLETRFNRMSDEHWNGLFSDDEFDLGDDFEQKAPEDEKKLTKQQEAMQSLKQSREEHDKKMGLFRGLQTQTDVDNFYRDRVWGTHKTKQHQRKEFCERHLTGNEHTNEIADMQNIWLNVKEAIDSGRKFGYWKEKPSGGAVAKIFVDTIEKVARHAQFRKFCPVPMLEAFMKLYIEKLVKAPGSSHHSLHVVGVDGVDVTVFKYALCKLQLAAHWPTLDMPDVSPLDWESIQESVLVAGLNQCVSCGLNKQPEDKPEVFQKFLEGSTADASWASEDTQRKALDILAVIKLEDIRTEPDKIANAHNKERVVSLEGAVSRVKAGLESDKVYRTFQNRHTGEVLIRRAESFISTRQQANTEKSAETWFNTICEEAWRAQGDCREVLGSLDGDAAAKKFKDLVQSADKKIAELAPAKRHENKMRLGALVVQFEQGILFPRWQQAVAMAISKASKETECNMDVLSALASASTLFQSQLNEVSSAELVSHRDATIKEWAVAEKPILTGRGIATLFVALQGILKAQVEFWALLAAVSEAPASEASSQTDIESKNTDRVEELPNVKIPLSPDAVTTHKAEFDAKMLTSKAEGLQSTRQAPVRA